MGAVRNITIFHTSPSVKTFFKLKYESIIHNNSSSGDKVHLLLSLASKSRHILVSSRLVNAADFSPDSHQNTFSLSKSYYGLWTHILVKEMSQLMDCVLL